MLSRLVQSFQKLVIPADLQICLIVVENDTIANLQETLHALPSVPTHPVHYRWEPRLGIPIARNRCLDTAAELGATHIAFVDDDEWLPADWLVNIWSYYLQHEALSAIQGPVLSQLPAGVSPHFLDLFQRKPRETGTELHMCMTNNVLTSMAFFSTYQLRFDESRPLAGGTDSKLFRQARTLGARLLYCAESPVYEEVPAQRITYRWLSKRHFRIGLTIGEHTEVPLVRHCLSTSSRALISALKSSLYFVSGNRKKHWKHWLKSCRLAGECLGPFGFKVNAYRQVDGE